jgi:hypothetical protein
MSNAARRDAPPGSEELRFQGTSDKGVWSNFSRLSGAVIWRRRLLAARTRGTVHHGLLPVRDDIFALMLVENFR